uniref:CW domain-containing protein n=1 Tax=Caenorhabditis tropicalis TaxID=1561998 RepID=A0A1I7U1H2_9PELO
MAIVTGEPLSLDNASSIVKEAKSFDECTLKCLDDTQCVVVYQSNSTDSCYLFSWESIYQVIGNSSGGSGTVGFKVYTEQPACELNSQFLLNGKLYPLNPNDTMNNQWKIDTSEDGWTLTYSKP